MLAGSALDQLYDKADIFVYPSVVESFGHPLLEAMAAGLPIVAADVPINRELCGDAATYFSPFDHSECACAIKKVATDSHFRQQLAHKGIKRVEIFRWSEHVKNLVQTLTRTVRKRS